MNLCELIRAAHSGNLSGSRVSCLGVVPLHLGHSFDVAAQSPQELLADISTQIRQDIIDGTPVPCSGRGAGTPNCDWGKRHTTRVNLQVVCTLAGHIAWISKP